MLGEKAAWSVAPLSPGSWGRDWLLAWPLLAAASELGTLCPTTKLLSSQTAAWTQDSSVFHVSASGPWLKLVSSLGPSPNADASAESGLCNLCSAHQLQTGSAWLADQKRVLQLEEAQLFSCVS